MAHRSAIGLHLVLRQQGLVLLGLRRNTSYANGWWHLPAGHLERGESVTAGMAREAKEELGITISEEALQLVHVLHDLDADDHAGRFQLFFTADSYVGEVTNCEPQKCEELRWWPLNALPEPTVAYAGTALAAIEAGQALAVHGFPA
ncbi:NUDIX domain-containing protein [Kitasatospora sp. NPDC052896]|uniref:NUDIX hydrolase n=1 Tax=Kitasatospora sp. NPDC052896 TaxID=3364061 RepID=UPI0037C9607C